ncbi:PREDICTED: uncharacterized protein LOC105566588 [Vollenhovia emeryi]|uniref:uncharacterized protein LOC105566588 n=1 Tax=Vollenhovia emeryi TaxID=411798 RepID=UPI0005F37F58|nr:PREDICTED: uncharacterized protein LOC105566588 [Vollenhovia emeryi]
MKEVYLAVLLTVCTYVFLATSEEPRCFHFTWPGIIHRDVDKKTFCEKYNEVNPFTPCINPLYLSDTKPNVSEIWENRISNGYNYTQPLEPGSVCVKYTYTYSGAVINISYFVGRVTEDLVKPIASDCFVKYTEGYILEACACESKDNSAPCNSTRRNMYSSLMISVAAAVSLFVYKILDIP